MHRVHILVSECLAEILRGPQLQQMTGEKPLAVEELMETTFQCLRSLSSAQGRLLGQLECEQPSADSLKGLGLPRTVG